MSVDEPRQPAGWYVDPEEAAGERWWNGSQWTSHTRDSVPVLEGDDLEGQPPIAWAAAEGPLATIAHEPAPSTSILPSAASNQSVAPAPVGIPPGWYPDPTGVPAQRWWDGTAWSEHLAPAAQYAPIPFGAPFPGQGYSQIHVPYGSTTVVMVSPRKSVGVALLLTFFFGPLGMFYSTISGALIMLGVFFFGGILGGIATLGLIWVAWWPIVWVVSMIWGCVAASNRPPTQVISAYR